VKTSTALQVAVRVSELTGLCTTFQAKFGRRYIITPESPIEAYELHRAICDKQAEIAQLLDSGVIEHPMKKASEWWRWQNTMDTATAGELAREVNHLIASCAYFEAAPCESGTSPTIAASQEAIAGMLHPEVRQRVPVAIILPATS
jgi:hypothetical protein